MEIKNVISDVVKIREFISDNFSETYVSRAEQLEDNHSVYGYKFNKALNKADITYSLFGLPIDSMYAYTNDQDGSCLYLVLQTGNSAMESLVNGFGKPLNVDEDDYQNGDFDFLHWKLNGFNILLGDDFAQTPTLKQRGLMMISNIDIKDLRSEERLQ